MKSDIKLYRLFLAMTAGVLASGTVFAQSSVTLYGIVDDSIVYANSQTTRGSTSNGHSALQMVSGNWSGSRFGFKGNEDLGGGTQAIFQLESGFNLNTGAQQFTNAEFGRQAFVGVSNAAYGSLTAGRQYTPYYTLTAPYSPTKWLTGMGAHPGDIDSFDTLYRINNSLVYVSPKYAGFTFGGSYALGGVPGSLNRGSSWSAALQYATGPAGVAVAVQRINNSTLGGGAWGADSTASSGGIQGVSAINNGYQTAQATQRIGVTGGYAFSQAWDVSFALSNVQYIPGIGSAFRDTAIFNTVGGVVHFKPTVAWDLAGGYSYTKATKANGITDSAQYQQVTLSEYYSLSKRTGLYAVQAYQRAHGKTLGTAGAGHVIDATATVGDEFQASPSSTNGQIGAMVGIVHRF